MVNILKYSCTEINIFGWNTYDILLTSIRIFFAQILTFFSLNKEPMISRIATIFINDTQSIKFTQCVKETNQIQRQVNEAEMNGPTY